jgi:uncharacterized membrane protein
VLTGTYHTLFYSMEAIIGSLHPALVHIPIGLLFLYSLVEVGLLFFPTFRDKMTYGRYVMLVVGVIGALFALQSGESLEHAQRFDRALVEVHSLVAGATTWVYGILAIAMTLMFAVEWRILLRVQTTYPLVKKVLHPFLVLSRLVTRQPWRVLLAIGGGVLLLLTGALGGAIAHGPNADFITAAVYTLFF